MRWHVTIRIPFERADYVIDRPRHFVLVDITLAERNLEGPVKLVAIEYGFAPASLDNIDFPELHALECREARVANTAKATAPYGGTILGGPRVLYLSVFTTTKRTEHVLPPRKILTTAGVYTLLIDWESPAKLTHFISHAGLYRTIIVRVCGKPIENITNQMTDLRELGDAKTTGRTRRRSKTNT